MTLSETYKNLEDVFLLKNAGPLLQYKNHDHVIDLVDCKQSFYRPIYILLENKLFILHIYMDKILANVFIRLFHFLLDAFILFIPNSNRDLRLYINYWAFNNLII